LLCLAVLGVLGSALLERWQDRASRVPSPPAADETLWPQDHQYVMDEVVGHRPRRSFLAQFGMTLLDGTKVQVRRQHNNWGFIRGADLPAELPRPRILLLGDSHTMGIVGHDQNVAAQLEHLLQESGGFAAAVVLNAAAGYYSLYQYFLRATTLMESLRPDVVVVVVFMGNDFLELENVQVPHLDDALVECPASQDSPAETTSRRRTDLSLHPEGLFWQGMNQAYYLHENPDRWSPVLQKSERSLQLLKQLCLDHSAKLLVALLPAYQRLRPEVVAVQGELPSTVVEAGLDEKLESAFLQQLDLQQIAWRNMSPRYSQFQAPNLYATDFHIWIPGHRLLAEELAVGVAESLAE
jgi:hypothetical protein